MKLYDVGLIIIVTVLVSAFVLGMVSNLLWGPHNEVEEVCEEIIKAETGLNIDLTPSPPDKK